MCMFSKSFHRDDRKTFALDFPYISRYYNNRGIYVFIIIYNIILHGFIKIVVKITVEPSVHYPNILPPTLLREMCGHNSLRIGL